MYAIRSYYGKLTEKLEERHNAYLIIINIDRFQEINDLYGESVGDVVLQEFSEFLKEIIPQKEAIYRLHSDEFAHLCECGMDIAEFRLFVDYLNEQISSYNFV